MGKERREHEEPEPPESPIVANFRLPALIAAVSSVPGGMSLFGIDQDHNVLSTYYDPRGPNPQWVPWFPISPGPRFSYWSNNHSAAGTGSGSSGMHAGEVAAVSSLPGGISLFALDVYGVLWSSFFDPRLPVPSWTEWFQIRPERKLPDAIIGGRLMRNGVTAISSVPGGVSLFNADIDGVVHSTYFDPRVPNPHWVEWFPIRPEQRLRPLSIVSAVSSVPGRISLFGQNSDGVVVGAHFDPSVANEWIGWYPIRPERTFQGGVVLAVSSVPGSISLFVQDFQDGSTTVSSTYFDPQVANEWVEWFPIHAEQEILRCWSAVSTVSGGVSLYGTDLNSKVITTHYDPRVANPHWVDWFPIHPEQDILAEWIGFPPPCAVSSIPGGVSLFTVGTEFSVWSTYFDPRAVNEWVEWFPIHPEQKFEHFLKVYYH
jgi:hypothetical protein